MSVNLKNIGRDFCPHYGLGLFDHPGVCGTHKIANTGNAAKKVLTLPGYPDLQRMPTRLTLGRSVSWEICGPTGLAPCFDLCQTLFKHGGDASDPDRA